MIYRKEVACINPTCDRFMEKSEEDFEPFYEPPSTCECGMTKYVLREIKPSREERENWLKIQDLRSRRGKHG